MSTIIFKYFILFLLLRLDYSRAQNSTKCSNFDPKHQNKLFYILIEVDAAARQASALISDKLQTRTLRCQQTPDFLVNCKFVISFEFQTPDILVNCNFLKYTIWQNCKNFNIAGEFIFFRLKMPSLIVKTCKIVKCHTSSYFLKWTKLA